MKYFKTDKRGGEPLWGTYCGADVIHDFMNKDRTFGHRVPPLEEQMDRLRLIVGKIADKAGIDLSSLIDRYDLDGVYTVDPSPDTD